MIKIIKRIICAVLIIAIGIIFISIKYSKPKDPVEKDLEVIKTIADKFGDELEQIGIDEEKVDEIIAEIEEYNNETKYVITFDIRNETNPILNMTLHLPVDKEFFDSVEVGDSVAKEKIAELEEFSDNFGEWTVTVKDKMVRE